MRVHEANLLLLCFFTTCEVAMLKFFHRLIAAALIPCMLLAGVPMTAHAAIVSTEQAMVTTTGNADRERVGSFFAREDVQTALQAQGVDVNDAIERVKAMSDAEVAQLADRVDQAPAGAGVVGILLTVFVVLVVTDLLGWTSVFPFTRNIR
jgi:outer membrane receptor protein involved in Fe transport